MVDHINNGESGLSVREKLNEVIDRSNTLNGVENQVETNKQNIAKNATEIDELWAHVDDVEDAIQDLDVSVLNNKIDQEVIDRTEGDASLQDQIDTIEGSISDGGGFIEAPNDGKLYGRQSEDWSEVVIPELGESYDDTQIKADLATETQARIDGDANLQGQIDGLDLGGAPSLLYGSWSYNSSSATTGSFTTRNANWFTATTLTLHKNDTSGYEHSFELMTEGDVIVLQAPSGGAEYRVISKTVYTDFCDFVVDTISAFGSFPSNGYSVDFNFVPQTSSGAGNPVDISDDPPASPEEGDLWYSSKVNDEGLYCWDGEVWFETGGANGADGQDGKDGVDGKDGIGGMLISSTEPADKSDGMMWLDTSKPPAKVWIWDTSRWIEFPFSGSGSPTKSREIPDLHYLVVGGGGVGGVPYVDVYGGGGGAGGYRSNVPGDLSGGASVAEGMYPTIPMGTELEIVVGLGGEGTGDVTFTKAGNSALDNGGVVKKIESLAGGEAGINDVPPAVGGSGGGCWSWTACANASGTAGQGHAGGADNQSSYGASGGGGSASAGVRATGAGGVNGGQGTVSTIDGLNKARAGGGGGAGSSAQGLGQAGGGNGIKSQGASEEKNAEPNSGSGGGGGKTVPGNGGSGVVIVRYLGDQAADGGDITAYNGYTIHTFNASGTLKVWS